MATIYECFRIFLNHLKEKSGYGFNRRLAQNTNLTEQYISKLLNGTSYGSELTRRRIASVLNYSYEDFIHQGRIILADKDDKELLLPVPATLSFVPDWLFPLLADLSSLNETSQQTIKIMVKALKDAQKDAQKGEDEP